jgi:hypothetical protein
MVDIINPPGRGVENLRGDKIGSGAWAVMTAATHRRQLS